MNVVLVEPEIPPNTGNIARLCAATGCTLHLVGPLGFSLEDRYLRRAGLDYWEHVQLRTHDSLASFLTELGPARRFCFSAKAKRAYTEVVYQWGDYLVFGPETRGLPKELLLEWEADALRIPIFGPVRSLNLSSAVAVVVYEAIRQRDVAALE